MTFRIHRSYFVPTVALTLTIIALITFRSVDERDGVVDGSTGLQIIEPDPELVTSPTSTPSPTGTKNPLPKLDSNIRSESIRGQSEIAALESEAEADSPQKNDHAVTVRQTNKRSSELSVLDSPHAQGWYETAIRNGVTALESFTPRGSSNITYVRTNLKYPWIRVEASETKIEGEVVERWNASAGDHLILRKHPQVSEAELSKALSEVSVRILSKLELEGTYLVGIEVVEGEDGLNEKMLTLLSLEGIVASVEVDALIANGGSPQTQPALLDGLQWPLENTGLRGGLPGSDIDAISGWSVSTDASNVVVAVVDTGIDYFHEDLNANIWLNVNEIPDNAVDDDNNGYVDDVYGIDAVNNDRDPADDNGHGTHVAGIIGADGFNDIGISGVAPRVQLMGLKFLSESGLGYTSDALEVISYAKNNGAKVLNLSWGSRSYSEALFVLLQECSDAGMITVASAGNDTDNIDNRATYPAAFEIHRLLTVASVDDFDSLSAFSNYGPGTVELAAPGTNVFSTWTGAEGSYRALSGTSMAAPHVSGVAALLLSEFPGDSVDEILARLLNGCEPLDSLEGKVQSGRRLSLYGSLNAGTTLHNDTEAGAITSNLHSVRWVGSNRNGNTESGDEIHPSSVWYQWFPPASGTGLIQFSATENLYFDVLDTESAQSVPVLEGKAPGNYIFTASKNKTYSILVYGEPSEFTINLSVAPANDNREDAKRVYGYRWTAEGANLGATIESGEINVGFGDEHSVWWRWQAPVAGAVRVDTAGSDFDTMLAVFSANPLEGLVTGDHPELVFVVDVSGSAGWEFSGSHIPDLNNDGHANTVLDAEIAAVSSLLGHLNQSDLATSNTVRVVAFDGSAFSLDLDPVEPGIQTAVPSNADRNLNGILDIVESIETLTAGGGTNFRAALDEVELAFENLDSASTPNMIFFSDGKPTGGGSYADVVQRLRDNGTFIRAFGVGLDASLGSLILIDPAARIFSSDDELGLMISGAVAYNDDLGTLLTSEVNLAVEQGETYFIKVSGYDGESGSIRLNSSMFDGLDIHEQPQSASVEFGSDFELSAEVKGVPPLVYQWFLDGVAIEGANEARYEVEDADDQHAGDYQLMVNNTFDHLMSDVATVAIYRDPPTLLYGPKSQKAVAGANVHFDVGVEGTPPFIYQWYFADEPIPDSNAERYTVYDFSEEDLGRYSVRVSNASGVTQTAPAYLEISEAPFTDWRFRNSSGPNIYPEQTLSHGEYFYVFQDDRVVRTRDGLTWQSARLPIDAGGSSLSGEMQSVFVSAGVMIAEYNKNGYLSYYSSTDGLNWNVLNTPAYARDLSGFNGKWYLVAFENSDYAFFESDDLENWSVVDVIDSYLEFTLVEKGSQWRYLVENEPGASNWYTSVYDSGAWPTGYAEFGYGEGDEVTVLPSTSGIPSAYFLQPFQNEPGYYRYDIWGRVKYDTTVNVRFGTHQLYLDSSSATGNPQGDWVTIPRSEDINLSYAGDVHPFSVEVGRESESLQMSFDLELFASAYVGIHKAVSGDDRVIVLKRNGDVYVSLDGDNWTEHATTGLVDPEAAGASKVTFAQEPVFLLGKFVGWDGGVNKIYLSDDGIHWDSYPCPEMEVPLYSSTSTQKVPFERGQDMIEHQGQVLINHSQFQNSHLLASSDLLNWTVYSVPHEKNNDYSAALGKLASNGEYLFATLGTADSGVFGSISDLNVPASYQSLDVSRLRIIDGRFTTFVEDYADSAMFSTDSETWLRFLSGSKDAVYHDGNYYGLQRGYGGSSYIRKDSAVVGNTSYDWYTGDEANRVLWPFSWEPRTLRHFSGQFVAAGQNGGIATSTDAVNWTLRRASSELLGSVLHSEVLNGVWLGMTNNGSVLTSTNGLDFTEIALASTPVIGALRGGIASAAYGNGVYLVCVVNDDVPQMYRSLNAVDWVQVVPGSGATPTGVAFGEGWFVAVSEDKIYYSQEGQAWEVGSLDGGEGVHVVYHMDSFWICDRDGVFWNTNMGTLAALPTIELNELDETYLYNSTFRLEAAVGTAESSLSKVAFLVNGEKVFESTTGPFFWETADLSLGLNEIVIKAYDEYGRPSIQREEITVVFSDNANVMPGAFQHPDQFFQANDGSLYGLGKEQYGSSVRGAYLARSLNGRNWKQVQSVDAIPDQRDLTQFAELDKGVYLAGGSSDALLFSQDGLNWEALDDMELRGTLISDGETVIMLSGVVDGYTLNYSTDGRNWQQGILTRTGGSPGSYDWGLASVEYWKGRFVVLGSNRGAVAVSPDGFNWTGDNPFSSFGREARLVAGEDYIVSFSATLNNGSYPDWEPEFGMTAYFSEDGLNWTPFSEKTDKEFRNLLSAGGVFYGVNPEGVWRSTNLSEWEFLSAYDESNDFLLHAQIFETAEGVLAIDITGTASRNEARTIAVSPDFVDWEVIQSYPNENPLGLAYNNGTFVANLGSGLLRSQNGRNWIQMTIDDADTFSSVEYMNGLWVAVGYVTDTQSKRVLWSSDLESWNYADLTSGSEDGQLLYLNGVWLFVDEGVRRSTDLVNWTQSSPPVDMPFSEGRDRILRSSTMGDRFVLMHSNGFFSSTDGETWTYLYLYNYYPYSSPTLYHPYNLRFVDGYYVYPSQPGTSGPTATHVRSLDLNSWEVVSGFQKWVNEPWASIGNIGLSCFYADPDTSSRSSSTHITFDGGETYTELPSSYGVSDIVATEDAFYICGYSDIAEMSLVDLAVENTSISSMQTPGPDVPITIEFDVSNIGLADYNRAGELKVSVLLAPSEYLDGSRNYTLFETSLEAPLVQGGSIRIRQEVLVPRNLPAGDYHLGVFVDTTDVLAELNESNNLYFSPVSLIDIPHVTLTVNEVVGGSVVPGSTLPDGLTQSIEDAGGGFSALAGNLELPYNIQLNLVAKPMKNYVFAGWEEFANQGEGLLNLNMTADMTLTPIFRKVISISVQSQGGGRIQSSPLDLSDLTQNTEVSLEAVADEGWTFLQWEGDLNSTEALATVQANASKQIKAVFHRNEMNFEDWKSEHFTVYETPNAEVSSNAEDPDQDGFSNLYEYLLGTNPKDSEDKPSIKIHVGKNSVDFEFVTDPRVTDYEAVIYSSSDLKNWSSETPIADETTPQSYDRAGRRICAPVNLGNQTPLFFRLHFDPKTPMP